MTLLVCVSYKSLLRKMLCCWCCLTSLSTDVEFLSSLQKDTLFRPYKRYILMFKKESTYHSLWTSHKSLLWFLCWTSKKFYSLLIVLNLTLQVIEMFGAGTACVVCPVNRILYEGQVRRLGSLWGKTEKNSAYSSAKLNCALRVRFSFDTRLSVCRGNRKLDRYCSLLTPF